jgi:hypothetical protein
MVFLPWGSSVYKDQDLRGVHSKGGKMSKLLRGIAAGWGAKRMGGGCFSIIMVFILLWWLLSYFDIFN